MEAALPLFSHNTRPFPFHSQPSFTRSFLFLVRVLHLGDAIDILVVPTISLPLYHLLNYRPWILRSSERGAPYSFVRSPYALFSHLAPYSLGQTSLGPLLALVHFMVALRFHPRSHYRRSV